MVKVAVDPNNSAIQESWTHPPGILVSEYYNQPYGYTCFRSAGTKDWLIMYTISGKGIIKNNEEILECLEGNLTIIPPGTPHFFYTATDSVWEKLWAHFMPREKWLDLIRIPKTTQPLIHMNIRNQTHKTYIQNAFMRAIRYTLEPMLTHQEDLAMNALEEIHLLIASENTNDYFMDPRIKKVLSLLSQRYMEPHLVENLAKLVCLSPSRLTHLFKEQVGESIIDMLLKYRLKQAEKKLAYTDRSVTEIALEVGFNSPDYFTRQFTKFYGTNPSRYRKSLQEKSRTLLP